MKHAVPIDNKNITEDWIYDMFYDYVEKPRNKRSLVGYIGNTLVGAEWDFGDNVVTFRVIEGADGFIKSFAERLLEETNGDTSDIYTTVHVNGNYINLSFWYDED